jgi:hypothetical protein
MTLEEFVKNTLCKSGIQEATGVELTFKDGSKMTIHSDDHPALKSTVRAGAEPTVKAVQSAQGGMF